MTNEKPIIDPSSCVCVFDNPATMRREVWKNGRLQASICATTLVAIDARITRAPPARLVHMGLTNGKWLDGKLWGDSAAIADGHPGKPEGGK